MAIIIFAVPAGIIYLLIGAFKKGQDRIKHFQAFAAEMQLTFLGQVPFTGLKNYQSFRLFILGKSNRQVRNLASGIVRGFQVSIFDYWYSTNSGRSSKGGHLYTQTVVMVESPQLNLPYFSMNPEGKGIFHTIGDAFGSQDIDFATRPVFSSKYLLVGANEQQIRYMFNDSVLSYLESTTGLCIDSGGNRIVVYRQIGIINPTQIRQIFEEGLQIANLFLHQ